MIPEKCVNYLLSLEPEWSDVHKVSLAEGAVVISPADFDVSKLKSLKAINVAALGVLSNYLDIPAEKWLDVLKNSFLKTPPGKRRSFFAWTRFKK